MKKIIIIILSIMAVFCFVRLKSSPRLNIVDVNDKSGFTDEYSQEELCLNFIKESMSSQSGGIYTNYLENPKVEEMASGHEILSESEGLIMLYYARIQDKEEFDKHFNIVKDKMLDKTGLVRWRIKEDDHTLSISSASIDDLRILRALIHAYEVWNDKDYYNMMKKINKGMLKYNIYEGNLNNYYDMEYKYKSQQIDAAYIDLHTIKLLSNINSKWLEVYDNGLNVIEDGYLYDEFPLYKKVYGIDEAKYVDSEVINSIDAFLVILHLSEVGVVKEETIQWIRKQINYGQGIFAQYYVETGEPVEKVECTATYAIAARIAKNIGDKSLYTAIINRMLALQVQDETNPIYGSFGDIVTLKVYSFDNLQALLAFKP
jgi:hypothetical protein